MAFEDKIPKKNISTFKKGTNTKNFEAFKKDIKKLSYEESISELEIILKKVQDENISLDQIQINYIRGHLLLEHCEELLQFVEQDISRIDPSFL
tara:strand:+ start:14 stop:295 length:282 start_codon:yes stop_codon:yes gene_type:complete